MHEYAESLKSGQQNHVELKAYLTLIEVAKCIVDNPTVYCERFASNGLFVGNIQTAMHRVHYVRNTQNTKACSITRIEPIAGGRPSFSF